MQIPMLDSICWNSHVSDTPFCDFSHVPHAILCNWYLITIFIFPVLHYFANVVFIWLSTKLIRVVTLPLLVLVCPDWLISPGIFLIYLPVLELPMCIIILIIMPTSVTTPSHPRKCEHYGNRRLHPEPSDTLPINNSSSLPMFQRNILTIFIIEEYAKQATIPQLAQFTTQHNSWRSRCIQNVGKQHSTVSQETVLVRENGFQNTFFKNILMLVICEYWNSEVCHSNMTLLTLQTHYLPVW